MNQAIGLIAGAALTLVGSFAAKLWDEWKQSSALRGAFRAEIAGLLSIAEARKHEQNAELLIAAWKAGSDVSLDIFGTDLAFRDLVYHANVGKIGTIGRELAAQVAEFYMQLLAVRITLQSFENGRVQALPLQTRIAEVENALAIWLKAKEIGARLVTQLLGPLEGGKVCVVRRCAVRRS